MFALVWETIEKFGQVFFKCLIIERLSLIILIFFGNVIRHNKKKKGYSFGVNIKIQIIMTVFKV